MAYVVLAVLPVSVVVLAAARVALTSALPVPDKATDKATDTVILVLVGCTVGHTVVRMANPHLASSHRPASTTSIQCTNSTSTTSNRRSRTRR